MNIHAKRSDIRAERAFSGTSWSPEERESRTVSDYIDHMIAVSNEFSVWETTENAAALAEDLEAYRAGYAARLNAYLASHSRVVSQFIVGRGGWTASQVRTMEKRNDTVDRRLNELREWSEHRLDKLRNRYDPRRIARRPIRSGDVDAIERLEEKIARLEAFQEAMKQANKIIRAKLDDEEKIDALVTIDGVNEDAARKLLRGDFAGRVGFPSYALTNNSANIRRLKDRLDQIKRQQEQDAARQDQAEDGELRYDFDGGYVLDNIEADRLQVYHDAKPPRDVIDSLKRYGLRWTPSAGCWQAYRTPNGRAAVEAVTGVKL